MKIRFVPDATHVKVKKKVHTPLCEGNHEKLIPSISRGFITIAIGVHPSRSQIKNKILRIFLNLGLYKGLKVGRN